MGIQATVVPLPDEPEQELLPDEPERGLEQRVVDAVVNFFDAHTRGEDGKGWPFGRNVFVSEMYSLLDQLPGVDYVTAITLTTATPGRRLENTRGELIGIDVKPYELVKVEIARADVTVQAP